MLYKMHKKELIDLAILYRKKVQKRLDLFCGCGIMYLVARAVIAKGHYLTKGKSARGDIYYVKF